MAATEANVGFPGHAGLFSSSAEEETCPPHPGFMHGMCIRCGQMSQEQTTEGVALR